MTDSNRSGEYDETAYLSLDDLTADIDTCMACVGLALGAAAATMADEDATVAMVGILGQWPDIVHDSALAVGMRVALAIASARHLGALDLGDIAATLLETDTETEDGNDE